MTIRPATKADCAGIAAIWNPIIRESAATFTTLEKTPGALAAQIAEAGAANFPFLVAEGEDGAVLGFAFYAQFRAGPGYRHTMEHSVHLAPGARGQGLGRALMAALEAAARERGVHSLVGALSGENAPALDFHRALGFREVGRLARAGRKFDRWMDLVLVQKFL